MSIRVAVAGAAGRMGQTVCAAVDGADDLELTGRADPALGVELASVLDGCDVVVDFTRPDTALENARAVLAAGRHVVIGTTGFDIDALRTAAEASSANAFVAPNFAIGAVLLMRFAAEASRHMARAEIIEYRRSVVARGRLSGAKNWSTDISRSDTGWSETGNAAEIRRDAS